MSSRWKIAFFAPLVALGAIVSACSSDPAPPAADVCLSETKIDRFKELVIVDEAVVADPRGRNATNGPWSFRHTIEQVAPAQADLSAFTLGWLGEWINVKEMNGFPADRPNEGRADSMNERVVCPWLKRTPGNECDATCGTCKTRKIDLSLAPFRLIAIANRMDERTGNPIVPRGEGRLMFALTDGAGDDPASHTMPMTIIFEYFLSEERSLKEWATVWHSLGKHAAFDEPYKAELETVTRAFTDRGARKDAPNQSALYHVRTNENALNWIWQLREFGLTPTGELRQQLVRNTPAESLNGTPALVRWVQANSEAIRSGRYEMPPALLGPVADQLLYTWRLPGVDEPTRSAFASGTCNGCHSSEKARIDLVFHVSPFRQGAEKLSPFLNDPTGRPDELGKRSELMARALCGLD
jgi:hypothetical protein